MGEAHELPLRERLGDGELHAYLTVLVRHQMWQEERCLVQVLASSHLGEIRRTSPCSPRIFRAIGSFASSPAIIARFSHCAVSLHFHGCSGCCLGHPHCCHGWGWCSGRKSLLSHGHRPASSSASATKGHVLSGTEVLIAPKVGGNFAWELTVRELEALVLPWPPATHKLQVLGLVLKGLTNIRAVLTEDVERGLPLVRLELVEALVIERGNHLGHGLFGILAGDDSCPGFLFARLHLVGEVLPLDGQVLVGPRNIYLVAGEIGAILAHHRHVQRESAAHGLVDGLLDLELCQATLGPERLQYLAAMDDFHIRPGMVITTAPERHEIAARLDGPRRRLE